MHDQTIKHDVFFALPRTPTKTLALKVFFDVLCAQDAACTVAGSDVDELEAVAAEVLGEGALIEFQARSLHAVTRFDTLDAEAPKDGMNGHRQETFGLNQR